MLWTVSQLEFISAAGRRVPVELRRRKGTRHLRLSLSLENSIVLSLPWHCSERAGRKFIEQHRKWLEHQLDAAPQAIGLAAWLRQSPWLTVGCQQLPVAMGTARSNRACYRIDKEEARIELQLPQAAGEEALAQLVRKLAKEALSERTAELALRHELSYSRLSVRNQSSRWGSCSSKRAISLNWRLVLIPPGLQDYIILHELAHLREMNHSKKFWQLLDSYDLNRREHEAALDALTPKLMRVRG